MDELREEIDALSRQVTNAEADQVRRVLYAAYELGRQQEKYRETELELVTKCVCGGTGEQGGEVCNMCGGHGTGEITRPMTVAEVLEWAQDVATWETTPIEGGTPFPDFKGARVRVRK